MQENPQEQQSSQYSQDIEHKNDNSAHISDKYRGLIPFDPSTAPVITKAVTVSFRTDAGDLTIEVYPEAAPNASKRFLELVEKGFYNDTPIFRVVKQPMPFVAQFGINWRPGMADYKNKNFDDDPSLFQLLPGTLAFAKAGPNTSSTQVFINYDDNSPLRAQGFTTFARITEGYENSEKFKSVGDPGMGLDQERLWSDGESYLKSQQNKPNIIIKAVVVKKDSTDAPPQGSSQAPQDDASLGAKASDYNTGP
ncbi:MAG: peptidylprolyl isomerase [bacterium]|nr:peptidylprolyl isomerase [bacterium]